MEPTLEYKYDEYEDDFEEAGGNDKNKPSLNVDYNIQTDPPAVEKVPTQEQQMYGDDFVSHPSTPHEKESPSQKVYENTPNREKMIQQNIKLKTQIFELAKQMDEIMQKQRKSKKYGIHADEIQDDETMKQRKAELKKQQVEIINLKNKIFLTKRQLEHVYDSRGIQGKEDELKNLQKQLKILQDEKQGLMRVKRQQTKALKLIKNDNEYEEKVKNLREQISKAKQDCKHLSQKLLEDERVLRKNHEIYITKQSKIKQMQQKIKQNKQKSRRPQAAQSNNVTQQMIQQLDNQIADLQKERRETQKTWNDKIQNIEAELSQKKVEEEKKLLILKQKEKQLKLNEIRIKELKKLIHHHTHEPVQKKPQEEQHDMKQFRHRRNIKHLQKQK